jgi:hypothetical protein
VDDTLQTSREHAKREINKLILEGQICRDEVESEYRAVRLSGRGVDDNDIRQWSYKVSAWEALAFTILVTIFPTVKEANVFRLAQPSPIARVGESYRWSGLDNKIRAQLSELQKFFSSIDSFKSAKSESASGVGVSQLAEAFEKHGTSEELELLCGAMGNRLDEITNPTRLRLMALRVFQYFEQRDRVNDVLAWLDKERDDVGWHEFYYPNNL